MDENIPRMIVELIIVGIACCVCGVSGYFFGVCKGIATTVIEHEDDSVETPQLVAEPVDNIPQLLSFPIHKGPTHYHIQHDNGTTLYDGYDSVLAIAAWEEVIQDPTPITSSLSWIENGQIRDRRELA